MTIYYTKEHEYIKIEGNTAIIGITDYAQKQLGNIVFIELPEIGKHIKKADNLVVIESIKAASDICSPIDGEVTDINQAIVDNPEIVNEDPYNKGWFIKVNITNKEDLKDLLNEQQYQELLKDL